MKLLTSSFAPAAIFMKDESLDLACQTESVKISTKKSERVESSSKLYWLRT
jgi:hypothetical protein